MARAKPIDAGVKRAPNFRLESVIFFCPAPRAFSEIREHTLALQLACAIARALLPALHDSREAHVGLHVRSNLCL